jgi:hypothetical protein
MVALSIDEGASVEPAAVLLVVYLSNSIYNFFFTSSIFDSLVDASTFE